MQLIKEDMENSKDSPSSINKTQRLLDRLNKESLIRDSKSTNKRYTDNFAGSSLYFDFFDSES